MIHLGKRLHDLMFTTERLRKQAYIQFYAACIGLPTSFFLPQRIQIVVIAVISWWAIIISAQTFIAAAEANVKAKKIEEETVDNGSQV